MSLIENPLPGVPAIESPLYSKFFSPGRVSAATLKVAEQLRSDGFAVIDFPDPDFDKLAATIIETLNSRYDWEGWRNGTVPNLRVQDAWKDVPEVKRIACNPQILKLLGELYGRPAFPFQTLNFPVGTQQHFHSDSIHFSSHPERFMAGIWVALEDIDSNNGPLVYYPGSHRLPVFTNEHIGANPDWAGHNPYEHYELYQKAWEEIVEALDLKPLEFYARKGQALIWSANLLHGGAAQKDIARTRYSQVTHYFFEGCSYYTPLGSIPFLGPIQFREITDVTTGEPVPNMLNGLKVSAAHLAYTNPKSSLLVERPKPTELPADFDPVGYLNANPDVKAAKKDAGEHWLEFGYRENRRWK